MSIVHCPLVSARSGSSLNSFSKLRDMGINIAMGTDTAPADMLMNLLVGLVTCRMNDGGPERIACRDLFDAATLGGAQALGRADLGRIAPGAKADLAIFRLDDVVMTPAVDPITTLVTGGSGKVTDAVFVDGRLSMRAGQVAGIDMAAARAVAQAQFDRLVAQYPARTWDHPPVTEIFPQLSGEGMRACLMPSPPASRCATSWSNSPTGTAC